jgi:hypothetical protein
MKKFLYPFVAIFLILFSVSDSLAEKSADTTSYSIEGECVLEPTASSFKTFTGSNTQFWDDPLSWSPLGVPLAIDSVIINADCFVQSSSGTCNDITVNVGKTLTIDGNLLNVNGILTGPGNVSMTTAASILQIQGDNTSSGSFFGGSGLVRYTGAANQIVRSGITYYHLEMSGAGTANLVGNISVDGDIFLTAGTLDAGSNNITLRGNWIQNASFSAGTGVVSFIGSAPQVIAGSVANTSFHILNINKDGFTDVVQASIPIVSVQTVINIGILDLGIVTPHNLGSTSGGGNLALSASPGGNTTFPSGNYIGFFGGGTVIYNSADSYTIGPWPGQAYKVIVTGGGTKTLGSATYNLSNDLQLDASTSLDFSNAIVNIDGNLNLNGSSTGSGTAVTVQGNLNNSGNMSFAFGAGLFTIYGDLNNTSFSFMGGDMLFASTTADQTINCINCNFISLNLNKAGKRLILNGANPSQSIMGVDFQSDGIFEIRSDLYVNANIGGPQKITTAGSFGPSRMLVTNGGTLMLAQGSNANFTGKFLPLGTPSGLYVPFTFTNAGGVASGCNIVFSAFDYTPPFTDYVRSGITINADAGYSTVQDIEFSIGFGPGDVQGSPTDLLFNGAIHAGYVNIPGQSFGVNALGNNDLSGTWTAATLVAPVISSFAPDPACEGSTVIITGSGFTGTTDVLINGTSVGAGGFTEDSDTQLTIIVPVGASTGNIDVTTAGGTGSSGSPITINTGFYVPDANFVAWLTANYPGCMCGNVMDTTCAAIVSAVAVNLYGQSISDLTGVKYFTSLAALDCGNNLLTTLPQLPPNLASLSCNINSITSLPALPASLQQLNCTYNFLNSLPALPASLQGLFCYNNSLTTLPSLPASLQNLQCGNNTGLGTLPALPSSLQVLYCDNINLTTLPALPSSLTDLNCYFNNITVLPALPSSLQNLNCTFNGLTVLPTLPNSLCTLTATSNAAGLCYPNTPTCPTFTADISLCALASPSITSFNPSPACEGSVVTITGTGFTGTTDVQINGTSVGGGNYTEVSDTQIDLTVPVGATSGLITITTGGGSGSSATSLTVNSASPSAGGVLSGPSSVCQNQTGVAYSFPADPDATTYVWYVPSDATIVSGNNTTDIVVDFGVISDNVAVYAQNACGNGPTIGKGVTVLSPPTATISGGASICAGDTDNLTVTFTGTGPWDFTYTDGVTPVTINGVTSPYTLPVSPASTTTYTLTAVTEGSCTGTFGGSATTTVLPAPTATISGGNTICTSGTDNLTVTFTGTGPWDFTYTDGVTPVTINGVTSPYTLPVSPTATTTYTLTAVTDGTCAGTVSGTATTTVSTAPTAAISGTQTICAGNSANLNVNLTGTGPWDFTYTDGVTPVTINGVTSPYTLPVSPVSTTTYTLTSVSESGCTGTTSGSAVVTVNSVPTATTSKADVSCFGSNDGTINIVSAAGGSGSYEYSVDNGSSWGGSPNIGGLIAGSYDVVIRDQLNPSCMAGLGTVTLTQPPSITATLSAPTVPVLCAGGTTDFTVTLTGTGPFSFDLSNGSDVFNFTGQGSPSTVTVTPTVTADWSVINLSDASCTLAGPFGLESVTVNTIPSTPSITGSATVCSNQTGVTYSIAADPAATGYTWSVPLGATITAGAGTTAITVDFGTTSGNVDVTADNACGSSPVASFAVTVTAGPNTALAVTPAANVCFGSNGTVTITASEAGVNYTPVIGATPVGAAVSGTGGNINLTVIESNLVAGNNIISIKADNGACAPVLLTNTCAMNYDNSPGPVIAASSTQLCGPTPVTLSVPAGASSYQWYLNGSSVIIGANTFSYTVVHPANYSVDIITASGCALSSAPQSITSIAPPTITASGGVGNDTLLTAVAPGATYYQWYAYAGQKAITTANASSYRLYFISDYSVAVNINGCRLSSALYTANNGSMSMLARQNFMMTDSTIYIPSSITTGEHIAEVFPNPSNGRFTVNYKCHSSKEVSIKIYNSAGKQIAEKNFGSHSGIITAGFDEFNFSPGIYMISITENEKTEVRRFTIF